MKDDKTKIKGNVEIRIKGKGEDEWTTLKQGKDFSVSGDKVTWKGSDNIEVSSKYVVKAKYEKEDDFEKMFEEMYSTGKFTSKHYFIASIKEQLEKKGYSEDTDCRLSAAIYNMWASSDTEDIFVYDRNIELRELFDKTDGLRLEVFFLGDSAERLSVTDIETVLPTYYKTEDGIEGRNDNFAYTFFVHSSEDKDKKLKELVDLSGNKISCILVIALT